MGPRYSGTVLLAVAMFSFSSVGLARGRPVCGQMGAPQRTARTSLVQLMLMQTSMQTSTASTVDDFADGSLSWAADRFGDGAMDIGKMWQLDRREEKEITSSRFEGDISYFFRNAQQVVGNAEAKDEHQAQLRRPQKRERQQTGSGETSGDDPRSQSASRGSNRPENAGKSEASDLGDEHKPSILGVGSATSRRRRDAVNVERKVAKVLGVGKSKGALNVQWEVKDLSSFLRPASLAESMANSSKATATAANEVREAPMETDMEDANANSGRATYRSALKIAKNKSCLDAAVDSLKLDFWSASTRSSRDTKRKFVVELAKAIGGEWWAPPLDSEMILKVAASVKEAKLKSGPAIINDLKLWHVEQGFEVPEWMARMLQLVKKSLTRNVGPPKRAIEVKIADQREKLWTQPRPQLKVTNAALAFAWATTWMLRCAEVVNVKRCHVTGNLHERTVTLTIPISKMDQRAWGVRRTLACCRRRKCTWSCAWKLWTELESRTSNLGPEDFFFQRWNGDKAKTAELVECWKEIFRNDVSGHSGRRSGAMMYVRAGMHIQDLAFLGRWKSDVVLKYAEEALEEMPVNSRTTSKCLEQVNVVPGTPGSRSVVPATPSCWPLTPGTPQGAQASCHGGWEQSPSHKETELWQCVSSLATKPTSNTLWVYSTRISKENRVLHSVASAEWDKPFSSWRTTCGWPFADGSGESAFASEPKLAWRKCHKCKLIREKRDDVNEKNVMRLKAAKAFENIAGKLTKELRQPS